MRSARMLACALALCVAAPGVSANLPEARRIVFLGDSITHAGGYVDIVDAALTAARPERTIEIINVGLSSETVSGLSEEGHAGGKFPRPDLHERLDRVLAQTRPDLVVACYGMNDGIYYPLAEERFARFRQGMTRLHDKVLAAGAKIIHLTPALFDALPIQAKVLPAGRDAYPQPYAGYDEVLTAYANWLVGRRGAGWTVLDVHAAMRAELDRRRAANPSFTFSKDGVHPNAEGHLVMARPLLDLWGLKVGDGGAPIGPQGAELLALVQKKQRLLTAAWHTAIGHKRPGVKAGLPLAEAQKQAAELDTQTRRLAKGNTASVAPPADPVLTPIEDVPGLPRVLLIGDSVSMGYTLPTRKLLAGKANVHRPATNCSSTGNGLTYLAAWLGDKKWDVIHFNFGLHDAKLPPEGIRHAPPEVYEKNLRELVRRMKATGAKLIWATTTPVPLGGQLAPNRRFGDVNQYNAIARRVMEENGVAIDDLNTAIAPHVDTMQRPRDVHFTEEGSQLLAKQVAASIQAALAGK